MEMSGYGYGDRDLSFTCHGCCGDINHDFIRVAKFKNETENLLLRDWPLGGTILSPSTGAPDAPNVSSADAGQFPNTFPNRLIQVELRSKIIDLVTTNPYVKPTMNDVKTLIESAIINKNTIRKINNTKTFQISTLQRAEKLAIRKMMSRYWENSSIFALELGGAVIRQSVFVDKMHGIDWLHSPAARKTMDRLVLKYSRFMDIVRDNRLHVCVPTLDVDLAWHTHQLSPLAYFDYTTKRCKKFIDHDDKMDEDSLSAYFEWTSKTYEKLYQEVYSECTCWYCEGIPSSPDPFVLPTDKATQPSAPSITPKQPLSSDPLSTKRLSTHSTTPAPPNNVPPTTPRTSVPTPRSKSPIPPPVPLSQSVSVSQIKPLSKKPTKKPVSELKQKAETSQQEIHIITVGGDIRI